MIRKNNAVSSPVYDKKCSQLFLFMIKDIVI